MPDFKPFQTVSGRFEGKDFDSISSLTLLKQVHGDRVHLIYSSSERESIHLQEGDAIVCTVKDFPIAVKTADCVPILIAHPDGVIAAVHAGWRGTRLKILEKTLLKIRNDLKKDLSLVHVAMGPSICGTCYEVGEEVAKEFEKSYLVEKENDKFLLNLKQVNADMAELLGVPKKQITIFEDCTLCMNDEYYSYRHECQKGLNKAGRNYSWIKIL